MRSRGRLVLKNLSDNTHSQDVSYDYDLRGLTLSSKFGSDTGQGITNTFDGFGRLTSAATNIGGTSRTLTYRYDANGNRTRVTHPDGWFFEYGFDGLDRFTSLNESANNVPTASAVNMLSVDYHPGGGRHHLTRPSGASTEYLQDNLKRLESFSQDFYGTEHDLVASFDYNPASQVIFRARSNDLYAITGTPSRAGVYQPNGLNQYTAVGGKTLAYDGNGNLTSYRDANDELVTYGYDMENRLVSATGTVGGQSVTAALTWDPLGRLHEVSINGVPRQFLYDGDALVAEYSGSTLVRRYVHGDQVDEPLLQYDSGAVGAQWRRYLHADHQGSVIAQSGHTGMVYSTNAYDPYGIPAATNSGRFGYTGQAWLPELGLYHYKARVYHPRIGRFLQTDPIFYADDMNIYAYVGNDPFNLGDPTGMYSSAKMNRALARASKRYVTSLIATQVDSPAPGPADAVGAVLAVGTTLALVVDVGIAVFSDDETPTKADSNKERVEATDRAEGVDRSSTNNARSSPLPKPPTGPGAVPPDQRDPQRRFTDAQIDEAHAEQGGICPGCGKPVDADEAVGHHIGRHADGHPTTTENCAAMQ